MHTVEQRSLLVIRLGVLVIQDLGFVKQLVVKAEDTLVFSVSWKYWRSHFVDRG